MLYFFDILIWLFWSDNSDDQNILTNYNTHKTKHLHFFLNFNFYIFYSLYIYWYCWERAWSSHTCREKRGEKERSNTIIQNKTSYCIYLKGLSRAGIDLFTYFVCLFIVFTIFHVSSFGPAYGRVLQVKIEFS